MMPDHDCFFDKRPGRWVLVGRYDNSYTALTIAAADSRSCERKQNDRGEWEVWAWEAHS